MFRKFILFYSGSRLHAQRSGLITLRLLSRSSVQSHNSSVPKRNQRRNDQSRQNQNKRENVKDFSNNNREAIKKKDHTKNSTRPKTDQSQNVTFSVGDTNTINLDLENTSFIEMNSAEAEKINGAEGQNTDPEEEKVMFGPIKKILSAEQYAEHISNPMKYELTQKELEFARLLFQQKVEFVTSAAHPSQFPKETMLEVTFCGRSNVGKSSLINAIFNRTNNPIVKTSSTPGHTRTVNFFSVKSKIQDLGLMLIDLPGFGYTDQKKKESKHWQDLSWQYIDSRRVLKRVFLLVDSRHGLQKNDLEAMKALENIPISYQIVLTKSDKISQSEKGSIIKEIDAKIRNRMCCLPWIILTSAQKREGLEELRASIVKACFELNDVEPEEAPQVVSASGQFTGNISSPEMLEKRGKFIPIVPRPD